MKPLYNFMDHLPSLEGEPAPILPRKHLARTTGHYSSIDLGRGCPYQCSFCTIINVQGRKSRFRTPDDLEQIIRENRKQGIDRFFITDDNFARNSDWEILLDRVIKLQDEGIHCGFTIQVDTLCHKIPNFIEKATKAERGASSSGLRTSTPRIYHRQEAAEQDHRISRHAAEVAGARGAHLRRLHPRLPGGHKESILRDIEIIKRELPLDILEFFFLTPLPGSEDHKTLLKKGVWMDPDINKYDLDHRVAHHSKMTDQEWEEAYRAAWATYYTPEHIRTILKRAAQIPNGRPKPITSTIMWFKLMIEQEGVHPLEGGAFRLKYRRDRRRSLPLELPFVFYPRYWGGIARQGVALLAIFLRTRRILNEVLNAPDRYTYTDLAIAPPRDDEFEQLSLYHATSGGEAALARKALGDSIRDATTHAPAATVSAAPAE